MTWQLRSICVGIHEKRNNPHAYGHFDAEVTYEVATPDLLTEAEVDELTALWQKKARETAIGECDRWEAQVRLEHEIANAKERAENVLEMLRWHAPSIGEQSVFAKWVDLLPPAEQQGYLDRWDEAVAAFDAKAKGDPIPF